MLFDSNARYEHIFFIFYFAFISKIHSIRIFDEQEIAFLFSFVKCVLADAIETISIFESRENNKLNKEKKSKWIAVWLGDLMVEQKRSAFCYLNLVFVFLVLSHLILLLVARGRDFSILKMYKFSSRLTNRLVFGNECVVTIASKCIVQINEKNRQISFFCIASLFSKTRIYLVVSFDNFSFVWQNDRNVTIENDNLPFNARQPKYAHSRRQFRKILINTSLRYETTKDKVNGIDVVTLFNFEHFHSVLAFEYPSNGSQTNCNVFVSSTKGFETRRSNDRKHFSSVSNAFRHKISICSCVRETRTSIEARFIRLSLKQTTNVACGLCVQHQNCAFVLSGLSHYHFSQRNSRLTTDETKVKNHSLLFVQ